MPTDRSRTGCHEFGASAPIVVVVVVVRHFPGAALRWGLARGQGQRGRRTGRFPAIGGVPGAGAAAGVDVAACLAAARDPAAFAVTTPAEPAPQRGSKWSPGGMQKEDRVSGDDRCQLDEGVEASSDRRPFRRRQQPQPCVRAVFLGKALRSSLLLLPARTRHQEEAQQAQHANHSCRDRTNLPARTAGTSRAQSQQLGATPDCPGAPQDLQNEPAGQRYQGDDHQGADNQEPSGPPGSGGFVFFVFGTGIVDVEVVVIAMVVSHDGAVLPRSIAGIGASDPAVQAVPVPVAKHGAVVVAPLAPSLMMMLLLSSPQEKIEGDGVGRNVILVLWIQQKAGQPAVYVVVVVVVVVVVLVVDVVAFRGAFKPQLPQLVGLAVV
mmetsp:Transcript_19662/g.40540  ORF Transcript_19662/g.40540 Transcript_19662/m.40540 type:complete len:380 (-) Transcript_19662:458-1597(-)